MRNNKSMLKNIIRLSNKIVKIAELAHGLPYGVAQDNAVRHIMDLNERIEDQYATNWH